MTDYMQSQIISIIEELSQYTLGETHGLSDFSIKPSIVNEIDFYKNVTEVAKVLPLMYSPAKTTKLNITQEGKHPTERIMRETGYMINSPDGTVQFHPIFYDIRYLSREIFIIAMVYTGFNYVVRDSEVYFRVKHNPTIDKIIKVTNTINKETENIEYNSSSIIKDTQCQVNNHYNKKINNSSDKINKLLEKLETIKNN